MNYQNFSKIKFFWPSLINSFLTIISIYSIIKFNTPAQNFSVKGLFDHSLKDLSYRGVYFKCSNKISDDMAFQALNDLMSNYNLYINYNFVKYYKNNNGVLAPFNRYSFYSHPNFYIGSFNNVLFNYQFTHRSLNKNFLSFTEEDIYNNKKSQFYRNGLNMYDNSLFQIYLNKNSLYLNECYKNLNLSLIKNDTLKNVEVQNYICKNYKGLNKIIKKSLKIEE